MWEPDRLNFDIMREFVGSPSQWSVRRPYVDIARKLLVDEETVRNRLRQMRETGYLLGWRLMVNPMLIGRESSFLLLEFEDAEAKERAISQLKLMEGVVVIGNFYGKSLLLTLFHEGGDGLKQAIQTIASTCEGKILTHWKSRFPQSSRSLTETDWQIISLLLKNAERRPSEVAHDLRISTRTAKRRVNRMMSSYAFFLLPVVDLRKAGGVPFQLLVQCDEDKKRIVDNLMISRFDRIVFRSTESNTYSIFGIPCVNIAEGQEISKWIRKQEGVKSVYENIVEEPIHVHEWLEKEIQRQISVQHNMRNLAGPVKSGDALKAKKILAPSPA